MKTPEQLKADSEQVYVAREKPRQGFRLKPSNIGTECTRALYYEFRWCSPPKRFPGRMLRLFQSGFAQEARLVDDLRAMGFQIFDRDPNDPSKQISVSALRGHMFGFLDAVGREAPGEPWHAIEMKTHSQKSFDKLQKDGVAVAKPEHAAQMLTYCLLQNLPFALYVAVNKNTDEVYFERLERNDD
jgi:hypothetical protein